MTGAESRASLESVDEIAVQKQSPSSPPKKENPLSTALSKAKEKFSSSSTTKLAGSEAEYAEQRREDEEKQKRKEEYERLGLGDKVRFGQGGMRAP